MLKSLFNSPASRPIAELRRLSVSICEMRDRTVIEVPLAWESKEHD